MFCLWQFWKQQESWTINNEVLNTFCGINWEKRLVETLVWKQVARHKQKQTFWKGDIKMGEQKNGKKRGDANFENQAHIHWQWKHK